VKPDPETRPNPTHIADFQAVPDLAPILWHSFGTISALLQEIVHIYPLLSPPALTAHASNRVCNALALLQCVASHPETRTLFLNGKIYTLVSIYGNNLPKLIPALAITLKLSICHSNHVVF